MGGLYDELYSSIEDLYYTGTVVGSTESIKTLWNKFKKFIKRIFIKLKNIIITFLSKMKSLFSRNRKIPNTPKTEALAKKYPKIKPLLQNSKLSNEDYNFSSSGSHKGMNIMLNAYQCIAIAKAEPKIMSDGITVDIVNVDKLEECLKKIEDHYYKVYNIMAKHQIPDPVPDLDISVPEPHRDTLTRDQMFYVLKSADKFIDSIEHFQKRYEQLYKHAIHEWKNSEQISKGIDPDCIPAFGDKPKQYSDSDKEKALKDVDFFKICHTIFLKYSQSCAKVCFACANNVTRICKEFNICLDPYTSSSRTDDYF